MTLGWNLSKAWTVLDLTGHKPGLQSILDNELEPGPNGICLSWILAWSCGDKISYMLNSAEHDI